MFRLDGRSALVVGAAHGIGREVAAALGASGAKLVLADLDGPAVEEAATALGAESLVLDVTDPASVRDALAAVGTPDVVVTTVGTNIRKRLADYTESDAALVVEVNLLGTYRLLQTFGPAMAQRGSGSIVAFSSVRASTVEPGQGMYAATKAGVVQLVRTAAAEYGPRGVRCNVVSPGVVETPLTAQIRSDPNWYAAYASKSALGRWAQPHELAGAVVYLASDASSFVTGSVLQVDGGWTAVDGRYEPPA
jgi:NAD(P)-dependent dehydrogenase (short-subunit alcohol dehydrogenase family)